MVAPAEDIFDDIEHDIVAPLESLRDQIVEQVKDSLAVICTAYHHLGGSVDHRHSLPGEHPRYETGNLLESIVGDVTVEDHVAVLEVSTDVSYAPILENSMDRPIFVGVMEEYEDRLLDIAADAVSGI